jgi:hypothetical protein
MPSTAARKPTHRLAGLALGAAALAHGPWAGAQVPPGAMQDGLHVGSPASVLNDPVVKRCRLLAARRTDPNLDSLTTAVEKAAMEFRLEPVLDAVATCRAALAAHPNEPKVIIAHYNASEALSVLALGLKFPDSEEEALALALKAAANETGGGIVTKMLGFYLGSAYDYGVGTRPDRVAAMKWYAVAAEAGDTISRRELARLQAAKP